MASGPGNFIVSVERRSGGAYPALVREAALPEAEFWDQNVQKPFVIPHPGTGADARVDKAWHWPTVLVRCGVLEALSGRECAFAQLVCPNAAGDAIPVGQVLLVNAFPHISQRSKTSMFLWYLTAMPGAGLLHFGIPDDLKLLRPLVDIDLQFSYLLGHDGRMCLHADRHGSKAARDLLAAKYAAIDLQRVQRGIFRVAVSPLRWNDGRYFVADEAIALHCTTKLDPLR